MMPSAPISFGSSSYADVSVTTLESGLQSTAVHATVDLCASMISELPLDVFRSAPAGERARPVTLPSYLLDPDGSGQGSQDWIYQALVSWMLRGNVFGRVGDRTVTQQGAYPTRIQLLHPDRVRGMMEGGRPTWYHEGERLSDAEIVHRRVFPIPGVVEGLSVIAHHARQINLNLTLTQFGLQYFTDGAMPGAILASDAEEVPESAARSAKARFMAAARGNREPVVLPKGWTYTPIPIRPEESQFLVTAQMSAADCCRMFGPGYAEILGYESSTKGGSLTYANLQSREAHLLVFSLARWIRRAERLLGVMLPSTQFVKLNRDALLETTTFDRFQAYELALGGKAWLNVGEVRDLEDLDPTTIVEQPATPKTPASGGSGTGSGGTSE